MKDTEDFVTYEQAFALKNLGFKEECLHYYENSEENPIIIDNCYSGDEVLLSDLYYSFNTRNHKRFCDAPTLAQAQKWLFENKKLYIEITWCPIGNENKWYPTILELSKRERNNIMENYSSPEEALSAGITECIKLLEKDAK